MSKVELRKEVTLNLGNFENVKIGIGVMIDTKPDESEKKALARAMEFVDNALQVEVDVWAPKRQGTKRFTIA